MEFDAADLLKRVGGDRQLAARVLERFLSDIPRQLDALARAIEDGDARGGADTAHAIRGAAANVGVIAMSRLAAKLDGHCRGGELDLASDASAELAAAFARSHREIQGSGSTRPTPGARPGAGCTGRLFSGAE